MLKTLGAQIKEYTKVSIITPLFMLLEVLMETLIPYLMASLVDDGIYAGNQRHIFVIGGWMVLAACVSLLGGCMGARFGAMASMGFGKNLRKAMFARVQTFSFANIDKYSTAGLVTRMTTDVTNIQNAYQMILRIAVRAPASIICAMVMSFFISPRLASIYLIAFIFLALIVGIITVKSHHFFEQAFTKYDDLNASVQENVSAVRVVKAYVREDHETQKFKKASQNIYNMLSHAERVVIWNAPALQFAVYCCILLISFFGAHMIVNTNLQTGELMSMLTYCQTILMSLNMLSGIFVQLSMSLASGRRIAEVLQEESTIKNPENPEYEVPDGSVRFDNVTFRYSMSSHTPVLDHINLDIASGQTIGIIGGTGSSKSTLVGLISRLYDADTGTVYVGGKDVRSYDLDVLRNEVAVVLQQNVLFSGTIYENLRWGDPNATDEECQEAARLACADEFIRELPDGYNTYIEQGGTNVSGGQKQRLCIARALLKKPKILILDDSTSAVDTATDARIRKAFRESIPGTTKIIIAQRLSSVMDADRIVVLSDGQLNGFGTHEQLLKNNDIYAEIYDVQTNGGGDFDEGGAA